MLTKLFEVVEIDRFEKVVRTFRTDEECQQFLASADYSDMMSDIKLYIRPIWTNMSVHEIERLLKK